MLRLSAMKPVVMVSPLSWSLAVAMPCPWPLLEASRVEGARHVWAELSHAPWLVVSARACRRLPPLGTRKPLAVSERARRRPMKMCCRCRESAAQGCWCRSLWHWPLAWKCPGDPLRGYFGLSPSTPAPRPWPCWPPGPHWPPRPGQRCAVGLLAVARTTTFRYYPACVQSVSEEPAMAKAESCHSVRTVALLARTEMPARAAAAQVGEAYDSWTCCCSAPLPLRRCLLPAVAQASAYASLKPQNQRSSLS
mmetsp:Transcript_72491/g.132753  ORF Transcript_72491/g.132753 Transcript_72491/m.132753 type:complete len:251 (-) Transcript_72491:1007-1759(-)